MNDYAALIKTRREMQDSKKYADKLAVKIREALNPGSPFVLCGNLAGVLIQIDNMVTVLLKERQITPQ